MASTQRGSKVAAAMPPPATSSRGSGLDGQLADAAKRDQRFLKAVRVESHAELEPIYSGESSKVADHFIATVITSCSECADWRSCFHVKSHFQSTKDSKRLVHVFFWWKALLGPNYPVTDEMLREDVWKNLESTCDLGVKKENGHAKQPGGPVCINPHHYVAIDKMRMLAVVVDSALTFFGHLDNVVAAFQPVLDDNMNILKSVPDVDSKFDTIIRELTEAARSLEGQQEETPRAASRAKKAKLTASATLSSSSSASLVSGSAASSSSSACLSGRDRRGAMRARPMPVVRPSALTSSGLLSPSPLSKFEGGVLDVADDLFSAPETVKMVALDSFGSLANTLDAASLPMDPAFMSTLDDVFADVFADNMNVDNLMQSFDALTADADRHSKASQPAAASTFYQQQPFQQFQQEVEACQAQDACCHGSTGSAMETSAPAHSHFLYGGNTTNNFDFAFLAANNGPSVSRADSLNNLNVEMLLGTTSSFGATKQQQPLQQFAVPLGTAGIAANSPVSAASNSSTASSSSSSFFLPPPSLDGSSAAFSGFNTSPNTISFSGYSWANNFTLPANFS